MGTSILLSMYFSVKNTFIHFICFKDAELFRICIDEMQPTMAEKSLGKVSAGLYLRDISEVREGPHADNFIRLTASAKTPMNKDCCLALVGSEATYYLELFNEVQY